MQYAVAVCLTNNFWIKVYIVHAETELDAVKHAFIQCSEFNKTYKDIESLANFTYACDIQDLAKKDGVIISDPEICGVIPQEDIKAYHIYVHGPEDNTTHIIQILAIGMVNAAILGLIVYAKSKGFSDWDRMLSRCTTAEQLKAFAKTHRLTIDIICEAEVVFAAYSELLTKES